MRTYNTAKRLTKYDSDYEHAVFGIQHWCTSKRYLCRPEVKNKADIEKLAEAIFVWGALQDVTDPVWIIWHIHDNFANFARWVTENYETVPYTPPPKTKKQKLQDKKFPFGKYKGKSLKYVNSRDRDYLTWFAENVKEEFQFSKTVKEYLSL